MSKLIIVGASGVGKTTLAKRIITGQFETSHVPTLGVEVHPIPGGFYAWDCAGDDRYTGLGDGYYAKADCAIVMFDITSPETKAVVPTYIRDIRRLCGNIPIAVYANKTDLPCVPEAQLAGVDANKIAVYNTSVKGNDNITAALNWFNCVM